MMAPPAGGLALPSPHDNEDLMADVGGGSSSCSSDDIGSPDWIDLHLQNLSLQHVGSLFGCRADDVIRPMALSFGSAELEDSVVSDRAAAAAGDLPMEAAVAAAESAARLTWER